jgi:cysteine-rich repeat protein
VQINSTVAHCDKQLNSATNVWYYSCLDASRIGDGIRDCADGTDEGVTLCGINSIVDTSEGCDDWNLESNDGCSATCKIEQGYYCFTNYSIGNGYSKSVCSQVPPLTTVISSEVILFPFSLRGQNNFFILKKILSKFF